MNLRSARILNNPFKTTMDSAASATNKPEEDIAIIEGDDEDARTTTTSIDTEDTKMERMLNVLQTLAINDSTFTPSTFKGDEKDSEKTERWIDYFNNYTAFRGIDDAAKLKLFKLLVTGQAAEWLRSLPEQITTSLPTLIAEFRQRFSLTDITRWQKATSMWTREQQQNESVDAYITDIINMARVVPITDKELIRFAIVKGLKSAIKIHVLQSSANTIEEVTRTARVAEAAQTASKTMDTDVTELAGQMAELLKLMKTNTAAAISSVETPVGRQRSPSRVHFDDRRHEEQTSNGQRQRVPTWARNNTSSREQVQQAWRTGAQRTPPTRQQGQSNFQGNACCRCGLFHNEDRCNAMHSNCFKCGQPGHYSRVCYNYDSSRQQYGGSRPRQY